MGVCMHAWVGACVRGCGCAWVCACVGVCMRGCVRACMYACAGQASGPKEAKSKGDWPPSKNPHRPKQAVL